MDTAQRLMRLLEQDRARIATLGTRAGNVGLVFEQFARRVLLSVAQLRPSVPLSSPTIRSALRTLGELGIVQELTGQRRNRVFAYRTYLDILGEGAQPL
jgi:Fic family protein